MWRIAGFGLVILPLTFIYLNIWHRDYVDWAIYMLRSKPAPELSEQHRSTLKIWLKENSVHLDTVESGSGFDDMEPLKAVIGQARMVALGEAAHLNGDFYRMKHRMIEFLVSEMDFNVVAFEAPFAGALELNEYLLSGLGEPERALGALTYMAWITEEVLELVKWMRAYNDTHEKKITFYGFDNKPAIGSAKAVQRYLEETGAEGVIDSTLSVLTNPWEAIELYSGTSEEKKRTIEYIRRLIAYLEKPTSVESKGDSPDVKKTALENRQLALQHARVMLQYFQFRMLSISEASAQRDRDMADNVRWLVEREQGAKVILWAANSHISATIGGGGMGSYLRKTYGDDLAIFGLISRRKLSEDAQAIHEPSLPKNYDMDIPENILASAGLKIAVIDFRTLPSGIVSRYFNARLLRDNGTYKVLPWAYDGLVFIDISRNASPLVPIQWGERKRISSPSNLKFEVVDHEKPADWQFESGHSQLEYHVSSSTEQAYQGKICGKISRLPGYMFGNAVGSIFQVLKANPYRGLNIRFSAAARSNGGNAYLWLSIDGSRISKVFRKQEVSSGNWQKYQLNAVIPEGASRITYGLSYLGTKAAMIDDVLVSTSAEE